MSLIAPLNFEQKCALLAKNLDDASDLAVQATKVLDTAKNAYKKDPITNKKIFEQAQTALAISNYISDFYYNQWQKFCD